MWHRAFVGLGSNIGDSRIILQGAIEQLAAHPSVRLVSLSSLYLTTPVGDVIQDDFLNQVVAIDSALTPENLLLLVQSIEAAFGRERMVRWGPRTLDLDILFFGDKIVALPHLTIPHKEIPNRGFVLAPMKEIAPHLEHPVLGHSMTTLYSQWVSSVKRPQDHISRLSSSCPMQAGVG